MRPDGRPAPARHPTAAHRFVLPAATPYWLAATDSSGTDRACPAAISARCATITPPTADAAPSTILSPENVRKIVGCAETHELTESRVRAGSTAPPSTPHSAVRFRESPRSVPRVRSADARARANTAPAMKPHAAHMIMGATMGGNGTSHARPTLRCASSHATADHTMPRGAHPALQIVAMTSMARSFRKMLGNALLRFFALPI